MFGLRVSFLGILFCSLGSLAIADDEIEEDPRPVHKYAVSVMHYNIQYVAGGLDQFKEDLDDSAQELWSELDTSEEGVEDAIIRESFHPILELYARHPEWGADLEMQGLMLEIIQERHPQTYELMKSLDEQVSFDSFHYSDELWTAQPAEVMMRSRAEAERVFAEYDIRLGDAVFTQEGQFGMGMVEALSEDSVAILPKNLYRLHYSEDDRQPLYKIGDKDVVIGSYSYTLELEEQIIEVRWTFLDDGELLATGNMNPYLLPAFKYKPESVEAYEEELLVLESEGFEMINVEQLVDILHESSYVPQELPPILDGTWQPDNTANLGLWMGDGGAFADDEQDGGVRRAFHRSHAAVSTAQRLVDLGITQDTGRLDEAWRELMLGGVSDSTGWNPYITEVEYAYEHLGLAEELVQPMLSIIDVDCPGEGCLFRLNAQDELVAWSESDRERTDLDDVPIDVSVQAQESDVESSMGWYVDPRYPQASLLSVVFEGPGLNNANTRSLSIPWNMEGLRFLPAGRTSGLELVPTELFEGQEQPVGAPIAGGVFQVDENLYGVIDPQTMLLCARLDPLNPNEIVFLDATSSEGDSETWEIYFVDSEEAALDLAHQLVQKPTLWIQPEPFIDEVAPEDGCSCRNSKSSEHWYMLLPILALISFRRRKI